MATGDKPGPVSDSVQSPGTERAPAKREQQQAGTVLLRALRRWGDEAQLTQVLGALASAHPEFGRAFVELVLNTAEADAATDKVRALRRGGMPAAFECRVEAGLSSTVESYGRVDLRFDGDDLTLLIENKLYSGYGTEQVARYLKAIEALPRDGRSGLVAITRDVPTYGERGSEGDPAWLGSIRWARLYERLRDLPLADDGLRRQWKALLTVMKEDGDLGDMKADADLIQAWAQYKRGRAHLEDLLSQIWTRALERAAELFKTAHRTPIPKAEMVDVYRRGQSGRIVVQRDQSTVWIGLKIPAIVREPEVWFGFRASDAEPLFQVGVAPWEAYERLERDDRQLSNAVRELERQGFRDERGWWTKSYEQDAYISADDVPTRLLELVKDGISAIAKSRVLARDIDLTAQRKRGGPPREGRRKRVA